MGFPGFLHPSASITITTPPHAATFALGPSAPSHKLAMSVQPQRETNWCWAAVSVSICAFYNAVTIWTQCLVANAALPRTDCCSASANSDPALCNTPWYLDVALQVTANFRQMIAAPLSFTAVQTEVNGSQPIGCRIGWTGGGGHFVAIVGWLTGSSGTDYIDVSDPIYLDSQIAFANFAGAYQSGGSWTHSYLTIATSAAGGAVANAVPIDPSSLGA